MIELPDRPGVYQDQSGRAFVLYKDRWHFLVLGRIVDWSRGVKGTEELIPLVPASGNIEPDFKPFRFRNTPSQAEEPE